MKCLPFMAFLLVNQYLFLYLLLQDLSYTSPSHTSLCPSLYFHFKWKQGGDSDSLDSSWEVGPGAVLVAAGSPAPGEGSGCVDISKPKNRQGSDVLTSTACNCASCACLSRQLGCHDFELGNKEDLNECGCLRKSLKLLDCFFLSWTHFKNVI